LVFEDPRRGAG